jgi:Mn2+/Fe2+ NRAMP family transporter
MSQVAGKELASRNQNGVWARAAALQPLLTPLASLLLALALLGAGWRLLIVVALPALVVARPSIGYRARLPPRSLSS